MAGRREAGGAESCEWRAGSGEGRGTNSPLGRSDAAGSSAAVGEGRGDVRPRGTGRGLPFVTAAAAAAAAVVVSVSSLCRRVASMQVRGCDIN